MQNEAKNKIKVLVEKYEQAKAGGKLKSYSEEETKKDFILPLFAALGWDVLDKNEVSAEENIKSSGRVDYGFYLNERPKFYLEAKALKVDLNNEEFAKQSIRYSWNRGVTWAVLTDFESIKVFNAQAVSKYLGDKQYFEIPCGEFLEHFEQLWLLSKESFKDDLIDKEAEKGGKKLQKVPVGALLYKDLNECRELLTKELQVWNKKLDKDLLDEGVQKLLDRLIFVRVAEDRGVEQSILLPLIREWINSKSKENLYQSLVTKFRELDGIYNSNLFSKHPFEDWQEDSGATEKVIETLYGKKGYYDYDFKVMPSDVLGGVYENFLGYRLAQSKKGESGKDLKKRKEQGIYYTPPFIVEYIVKKTLKPILDKCKSIADLKKIKVLDPACGSGSFLVKALEVINDKYKEFAAPGDTFTKLNIVLENLYGVDLDAQAVDIARLNLLINCLDKKIKFPPLSANIKNGNSLISGTDEELKKYFGSNFREKKPFNWEEEFPEVFKQGGFDVIIGNPPWGANIDEDVKYFADKYPESTKAYKDTYKLFIDKSISLLKLFGNLGFIVPNTFLYQPRYEDIKQVVEKYEYNVLNLGEKIFESVQLPSSILVLNKKRGVVHSVFDLTKVDRDLLPSKIWSLNTKQLKESEKLKSNIIKDTGLTFDDILLFKDAGINYQAVKIGKAEKGKSKLGEHLFYEGAKKEKDDIEYWKGTHINKYFIQEKTSHYVRTNYKSFKLPNERVVLNKDFFNLTSKILFRQTASQIIATIDNKGVWFGRSLLGAVLKEKWLKKINIFYSLTLFNSKYIDYLYKQKVLEIGKVFPQVKLKYLRDLPFVIGTEKEQQTLSLLAEKMISLNKELQKVSENSDKWHQVKSEIEKTDKKIDEIVYKLYGLTEEEIKIVEEQSEK